MVQCDATLKTKTTSMLREEPLVFMYIVLFLFNESINGKPYVQLKTHFFRPTDYVELKVKTKQREKEQFSRYKLLLYK